MAGDTLNTLAGAKFFIAGIHAAVTDTVSEFAALTWTEVGNVEDFGEIGDESGQATFTGVADARTRRFKSARDAGVLALIVGRNALDAGQVAMKAAEATKYQYDFKIELADKLDANDTNSIFYWFGQVMSARDRLGTHDNVPRTHFNIGINCKPYEVAATEVP